MDKDTLYRFFEGNASFEEEETIKRWLETSPENQRVLLKERKVFDAGLLLGEEEKIRREKRLTKLYRPSSLRTTFFKAAALILLALSVNYAYQEWVLPKEPIRMQTITVPAGQRVNIMLPDGSNVWLNARTTIRYPFSFREEKREVRLDGQAYFDVVKDEKKPFIVQTDKATVEVFGTQFDVEAYSDREEFETTLMSGSVRVVSAANPLDRLVLAPDSKAYLEDGKLKSAKVDDYNLYRWKEGLICFRGETFLRIMKDFEKYYGITIEVKNREVLKYFYTGKFRQSDGVDYALRVLQKDIRFTYQRDDENRIIYIK